MNDEVLVKVEGVSKKFCRSLKKSLFYGISDIAADLNPFARNAEIGKAEYSGTKPQVSGLRAGEFWAVNDVSFELKRGECIGLIGHNGAGKTTLLKMLNGLIKPDHGRIEMRGRVSALIALGAGFNPILTGRENIYVNGSVLGLTKREIEAKLDDIIDFADIREFIDSPVQSYSSGMQVRLGFAVATALDPDVLILDEVLAVGDAAFRNKCYKRISELRKKAAVIFVSHNMEQVGRICDLVVMLQKGRLQYSGDVSGGIQRYEASLIESNLGDEGFCKTSPPINALIVTPSADNICWYERFSVGLKLSCSQEIEGQTFRLVFYNWNGDWIADSVSALPAGEKFPKGESTYRFEVSEVPLKHGKYFITIHIIDNKGEILAWSHKQHPLFITREINKNFADCQILGNCQKTQ